MPTPSSERILTAARELFLEGGVEAVTMRAVAERVGVTATALYRHFENKDALVGAVLNDGFQTFGAYLYRALRGKTPGERLELSRDAYLAFALEQPQMYRTIFMTPAPRDLSCSPQEARDGTFRFLADRVRECIEAGLLKPGEPDAVALTIWAHVHGLCALYLSGAAVAPTEEAFREVFRLSVRRLFEGLAR